MVINCPSCFGVGCHPDGSVSWSPEKIVVQPSTKCRTCEGFGQIKILQFEPHKRECGPEICYLPHRIMKTQLD